MDALQKLISRNLRNVCMPERMMVRHLLSRAVIYKPYDFSCSCQIFNGDAISPYIIFGKGGGRLQTLRL